LGRKAERKWRKGEAKFSKGEREGITFPPSSLDPLAPPWEIFRERPTYDLIDLLQCCLSGIFATFSPFFWIPSQISKDFLHFIYQH